MHHEALPHVAEDLVIAVLMHRDEGADVEERVIDTAQGTDDRVSHRSAFGQPRAHRSNPERPTANKRRRTLGKYLQHDELLLLRKRHLARSVQDQLVHNTVKKKAARFGLNL